MQGISKINDSTNSAGLPHMEVMPEIHGGEVVEVDPYKKPSKLTRAILFAVAGLIMAGGLAYGGWYGYTNYLSKPNSADLANISAENMSELKSYQVDMAINVKMDSLSDSDKKMGMLGPLFGAGSGEFLRIQGTSQVDNSDPGNLKSQSKFDISFGGAVFSLKMETKTIGQRDYIKISDLPTQLIGFVDMDNLGDQWIELGSRGADTYSEEYKEILDKWDSDQIKYRLEKLKKSFKPSDLLEVAQKCHNDTFEQSPVISCQFKLKPEGTERLIRQFVAAFTGDSPDIAADKIINGEDRQKFEQFLDNVLIDIHYLKNDHLTKAITIIFDNHQMEDDFSISKVFFQLKFSQYNQPQQIEAPLASMPLEKIFESIFGTIEDGEEKSRDSKRISDIKQIQTAFELYLLDHNEYPPAGEGVVLGMGNYSCLGRAGFNSPDNCDSPYMEVIPANPRPGGMDYVYTRVNPQSYQIEFVLENKTGGLEKGRHVARQDGIGITPPKPDQSISSDDEPAGSPTEINLNQKIIDDIMQIQTALELYYNDHNKYPGGMGVLGKDDILCLGNAGWGNGLCPATVYMSQIPSGKTPYVYIPNKEVGYYIFFHLDAPVRDYEQGSNIASPSGIQNISSYQDIDNDGLPDEVEYIIGTDPKKYDSDGDGYGDGQEVKNGYNPLGEGRLE